VQAQQGGVSAGEPVLAVSGAWTGRYLVGLGGTLSSFAVTADGDWTIEVQSIDSALSLTAQAAVSGASPDVIRSADTEAVPVTVEYTGAGPILVRAISGSGSETLLDETGAFSGPVTLPPGPGYVTIDAAGPWSLTPVAPAVATTSTVAITTTVAVTAATATAVSAPTTSVG